MISWLHQKPDDLDLHCFSRGFRILKKFCTLYAFKVEYDMSGNIRFPTMWFVGPAKAQTSRLICADSSDSYAPKGTLGGI